MATVTLGSKTEGSIVKLKENGVLVEFYIAKQNYEIGLNGLGWVLLVRKECYDQRQWNSANVNGYSNSAIDVWLNGTYKNLLDTNILTQMGTTKFYYTPGNNNRTVTTLERSVFMLSATELGQTQTYLNAEGTELSSAVVNLLKIAYIGNSAVFQWTRSPWTSATGSAWYLSTDGNPNYNFCPNTYGSRPAFTLPSTLYVSDDGSVSVNTAPTTPASINVPSSINGGDTITVSWSVSSDAEGNLVGYELDRSTDGGTSWVNIYKSSATITTNIVAFGTKTVKYRVRAYDSENLYSAYKESAEVTVVNNNAPTAPSSITVPNTVTDGATLTVTWGAASDVDGNLAGYSLERQVDGGGWSVIYTGNTLSYVDTITKGWAKVCYRVRAYDSYNAYSGYTTSPERTVNNNTAPTITCDSPSGSDLGKKTAGFEVDYSVDDVDSDTVTVTEAIDGVTKRTFQATLKQNYSFQITGETFMKLLNGSHTATITANDGKVSTVHNLTFSKEVTRATITLKEPMDADDKISICVLSVVGFIPSEAEYKVEVTNNANDDEPVWEDCTTEVKSGANHIFSNQEAEKGFAFNFRVTAERGSSGVGGYITSVQGGFQ